MRVWVALSVGLGLVIQTSTSVAGVLESLVMPGPVIQGHAKFEKDCDQCHSSFKKGRQDALCLLCHEDIDKDISRKRGFHGAIPNISITDCKYCHSEHKGREADIVRLDPDTFDHDMTEFALAGDHVKVACMDCHGTGKKYRDAPSRCVACHEADEPHKGRLGKKCGNCHDERDWRQSDYDHNETNFPLRGKHLEIRCDLCHANERYENTPSTCISCHSLNDVHLGRHGDQCDSCHSPIDWKKTEFDHDTKTDFPLKGKHRRVRCDACHSGDFKDDTQGKTCFACHENDDEHRGRNGRECDQCHSPVGWAELGFDHDKDTEFTLRGLHTEIACESCHVGHVFESKLETTCYACHKFDDSHQGALGSKCSECHSETGWKKVEFDHDKDTKFALRGAHDKVPCRDCHTAEEERNELATDCYSCHSDDDVHDGQEGEHCENCHNEHAWGEKVFFDHDLARFPLIGLHAVVPCEECHLSPTYQDTSGACIDCHESDDEHRQRLGPTCNRCHNPNGWSLWVFDHGTQTDYVLDGAHKGLACESCHRVPVTGAIELLTTCGSCHREDDVHQGSFGRQCDRCHVTESFDQVRVQVR